MADITTRLKEIEALKGAQSLSVYEELHLKLLAELAHAIRMLNK